MSAPAGANISATQAATRAATQAATQVATQIGRHAWLDVARGIGIILVAIGHALGGIIASPLGESETALNRAFFLIYSFHMPLFFLLSGILVAQRVQRDRRAFGKSLLIDLVWPYFLWSVVQFTVIYGLGSLANRPVDALWPTFLRLPYLPISQFWFIYTLFLLHALAILLLPRLGRNGFLLLCFALKPVGVLADLPLVLSLLCHNALWYGIAVFLAARGTHDLIIKRTPIVRALLLPGAAAAAIAVYAAAASVPFAPNILSVTPAAPVVAQWAWLPAGLLGSFAVIGLAGFALGPLGRLLGYLGRRTMAIFILHIMGIAGARIVMTSIFGITDVGLILAVSVIIGLIAPIIAFECAARLGWTRALGLGRA